MPYLMLIASQAVDSVTVDSLNTAAAASTGQNISLFHLLVQGGVLMIPIFILSLVAVYVIVERWLLINNSRMDAKNDFLHQIERMLKDGDRERALTYCDSIDKPLARILKAGIQRLGRPIENVESALRNAGKEEIFHLEKRMTWLATIAGIEPLLGFTGTVTGLMKAFMAIQALQGNVNPSVLAGGIWEALVTTVAGLIIGIIAYGFYNLLLGKINRMVHELENTSADFIDLLQAPTAKRKETTF